MFELAYDERVSGDIARLAASTRKRIQTAIQEKLSTSPEVFGKPLRHSLRGYRRIRVDDYRVIFLIQQKRKTVLILMIAHRSEVYKEVAKRLV